MQSLKRPAVPPAAAIELPDGTVVTGKTGPLLGAASSALLNALKKLAGIDQELDLVSAAAIEPIQTLKTNYLGSKNPRLHTDEILIALSSSAAQNPTAAAALKQLSHLKGCDMHSTVILSSVDMDTVKKLGMYLTCEPTYEEADRMKTTKVKNNDPLCHCFALPSFPKGQGGRICATERVIFYFRVCSQ